MHPDKEPETISNTEVAVLGCGAVTGLGCGLMVFVGGLILVAIIVLVVL